MRFENTWFGQLLQVRGTEMLTAPQPFHLPGSRLEVIMAEIAVI